MAIIYSYPSGTPTTVDLLIGTQASSGGGFKTKSFTIGSVVTLAKSLISLQDVVSVGNTIVLPTTVSKGIDITLANLETVPQNGIIVTIPNQTGTPYPTYFSAPDAYVAKINGQSPGTLTGFTGGFVVDANGLDNIGFYADLQSDSGVSAGCVIKSIDLNTGDLFRGDKRIGAAQNTVFKVANNGDTTANTLSVYDSPNGGYSKIAINDSYFTISRPGGAFTPMLSTEDGFDITLINGNGAAAVIVNNLTVSRSYTLPNASGTLALVGQAGGATNLTTSQTVSNFTINSDTGTDAVVPLGNGTLAGASLNNYTTAEQTKLAGIATGAEVNVNADWNAISGDAQILNKPAIPSISGTLNKIAKFTAAGAVGDSNLFDNGSQVLIGTTLTGNVYNFESSKLVVANNIQSGTFPSIIEIRNLQTNIAAGNSMGKLTFSSASGSSASAQVAFAYGAIEALAAGSQSFSGTSGGILRFLVGGAGNTGQTISEAMRINENGAVGINATSINQSAILEVSSNTKGFLPPRMTSAQKSAITAATSGLIVFDTTLQKLCVRVNPGVWETISSS